MARRRSMYIVVSKWEIDPAKEASFRETGEKMRAFMRKQKGVESVMALKSEDGNAIAIVCYTDEKSYKELMKDGGAFETAAKENNLEGQGTWMWSERGE